jgi:hypothetical protein
MPNANKLTVPSKNFFIAFSPALYNFDPGKRLSKSSVGAEGLKIRLLRVTLSFSKMAVKRQVVS